ncbi:transposase family protein [Neorhizobium sp. DT-125]|uniref:transposase family protein n=1 Tax=Neorhizobium sp. DT-125 TaxID=3396163 RepID=UPI003F541C37
MHRCETNRNCPDCGTQSRYWHAWHNRSLQDLPVQERAVKVNLTLNRMPAPTVADRCPKLHYEPRRSPKHRHKVRLTLSKYHLSSPAHD